MRERAGGSEGRAGESAAFAALVEETVALFHRLRAVAEQLHGQGELSGARRGVLLGLEGGGAQTVPQMARLRPVSRQHMQMLINELLAEGYVELAPNPAHKRSALVALTPKGREMIAEMRAREQAVLSGIDLPLTAEEMRAAVDVLRKMRRLLTGDEWVRAAERVRPKPGRASSKRREK